jgi:hypothetical protein
MPSPAWLWQEGVAFAWHGCAGSLPWDWGLATHGWGRSCGASPSLHFHLLLLGRTPPHCPTPPTGLRAAAKGGGCGRKRKRGPGTLWLPPPPPARQPTTLRWMPAVRRLQAEVKTFQLKGHATHTHTHTHTHTFSHIHTPDFSSDDIFSPFPCPLTPWKESIWLISGNHRASNHLERQAGKIMPG